MEVNRILAEIDAQISKLQQARELLSNIDAPKRPGPGRPRGSKNVAPPAAPAAKKRKLTPEGRKLIADAMKRRWAERKKSAVKT